ncbi:MAG: GntR family transcriptional regulator [Trueperaceae bacterium]|nr:GntR family transcriptional regulator [Trueperaceae bacterium]
MAHPTKKDLAYDFIKRRILEKRLLPGQRITASQIAEEIGTSVLPVREALLSLEAERLVSITPYVGAVVAWVSHDEVLEVISLLAVLEGYGTSQAAGRSKQLPRQLATINQKLRAAMQQEMWSWFIDLNREFHFAIFEASGNGVLLENIRVFWSQLDTMLASTSFHLVPNRAEEDLREHDELIRLLSEPQPDPLAIELVARAHRMRTAAYLERQAQPVV